MSVQQAKRYARLLLFALLCNLGFDAYAAELQVSLVNPPPSGQLIFQIYTNADAFGDFRDPVVQQIESVTADNRYVVADVPSGPIAVLVYYDENGNGRLDKNFIGIPRERLALSNGYRPKGPPSFERALIVAVEGQLTTLELELYQVLGERGRWGLGVGVIGQSSPYIDSSESVYQAIPAVTFVGERLQWFGPALRFGIVGSGRARLAIDASYRVSAYEEDDSPILAGLGDRNGTVMAGLGAQFELGNGFELGVNYQHDLLNEFGGGLASANFRRSFQIGVARLTPQLTANWLSSDLANYEFGVPLAQATAGRPAYLPGSSSSVGIGVSTLFEITEDWRLLFNLSAERLGSELRDSPLVDEDYVIKGFLGATYTF